MASTNEAVAPAVLRVPGGNGSGPGGPSPLEELRASLRRLLATLLERAFGLALDGVEGLAAWCDDVAARGGIRVNALLGGARAALGGRNPVWGALLGAVGRMGTGAKVALILALVLALVLLPVTVVLLLLVLIVAAVVAAIRTAGR
ncbi:hypothetical protein [Pseudonocardia sp. MH-G8]|uniref:hypothetical protein n=1 Tax=Pseudonocardia sp. MH-G8 TaxID=1854588 RepID=UPI000BA0425D|nr:hypothetical protein [Pseudonocardia sp. MH-G8]OZM79138.1 hypothetical protein CFP66_27865 [Pseudonocardia sp. MH-G8]